MPALSGPCSLRFSGGRAAALGGFELVCEIRGESLCFPLGATSQPFLPPTEAWGFPFIQHDAGRVRAVSLERVPVCPPRGGGTVWLVPTVLAGDAPSVSHSDVERHLHPPTAVKAAVSARRSSVPPGSVTAWAVQAGWAGGRGPAGTLPPGGPEAGSQRPGHTIDQLIMLFAF